jgi:RHS repeat-associated protein
MAATTAYFHTDWLGSTRYLSDSTGNSFPSALRYDAFGEVTSPQGLQPPSYYQFAGDWGYQSEWSASYEPGLGLEYLENRYYDPAIGRFISQDPIGFPGGLNLYGYSANDPANGADPEGLASQGSSDLPDLENAPDASLARQPGNRPFRGGAAMIGNWLKGAIECLASLNPFTSAGIGLNKLKEGKRGEAVLYFLPLAGEGLGAVGEAAGTGRAGGWLRAFHEGPGLGHTFENLHVGATDAELIARLASSKISAASTFLNEAVAEASISEAIGADRAQIRLWLDKGGKGPLVINYPGSTIIGRGIAKGEAAVGWRTNVRVVLRAKNRCGFCIRTAFPF